MSTYGLGVILLDGMWLHRHARCEEEIESLEKLLHFGPKLGPGLLGGGKLHDGGLETASNISCKVVTKLTDSV